MEKAHEITLAELFVGYDKEHPSERRPGNLTERLAPKIKVELSKQWPAIDWDSLKESIEDNAVAMLHIPVITDILLPAWREYQDLEGRISDDPEGKVIWLAQHKVSGPAGWACSYPRVPE